MAETKEAAKTIDGVQLPRPGTYEIDSAHSSVSFVARHLTGTKVRGHFSGFSGTIQATGPQDEPRGEATGDAASIDTGGWVVGKKVRLELEAEAVAKT